MRSYSKNIASEKKIEINQPFLFLLFFLFNSKNIASEKKIEIYTTKLHTPD